MVARARACVGVRFRPQGRDPSTGLDCLGLVLVALGADAHAIAAPGDYSLSADGLADRAEAELAAAGFRRVAEAATGDCILFEPAPGQAHFAIASDVGIVQAHLGVGRVVECPPDPAWAVRSVWRFGEAD